MIVLSYLAAGACGLASALAGLAFALSFSAWLLCEPATRRGRYAPRPGLALAVWTLLATATYLLIP